MFDSRTRYFRPRFCPACGEQLTKQEDYSACPKCHRRHYQNAKPCVGALVVREGLLLLARRRNDPFAGWWDIPGGFVHVYEHPEQAVRREILEETGLHVEPKKLVGVYVDDYQFGDDIHATLSLFYECVILDGIMRAGDDAIDLNWFPVESLPANIAFESARKMLVDWRRERPTRR